MLKYILLLLVVFIWFACKKTSNPGNTSGELSGVYNEVIPDSPGTKLDFTSSNTVIVSGKKLSNQPSLLLGTNKYLLNNGELVFYSDSASIKDTTTIWFNTASADTLWLRTCPFGSSCMIETFSYAFKKQ
ncbi:MAG TPA: hypothetical protein VK787_09130 [Puia sp.]|nr:hypothetical protein [Puia sp.]